jgi:hypothetical protein
MEMEKRIVNSGPHGGLTGEKGEVLVPPSTWTFLPSGDAAITRRVTSYGYYWRLEVKKGRRTISLGVWAPAATIIKAQEEVKAVRLTEEYKKKRISELNRREKKQELYDAEFCNAVESYLNFHDN